MQDYEDTTHIRRGCRVKLENINDHSIREFELYLPTGGHTYTDQPEALSLNSNLLNINSPLGSKLLGRHVNDVVGEYRILEIREGYNILPESDPVTRGLRLNEPRRLSIIKRLMNGEWLCGRFGYYSPYCAPKKKQAVQYITDFDESCQFGYSIINYDYIDTDKYLAKIYIIDNKSDFLSDNCAEVSANIIVGSNSLEKLGMPKAACTFSKHKESFQKYQKVITMLVSINSDNQFVVKNDKAGLIYYLCDDNESNY